MIGDVGNMTMLLVCGNGITDEYRQPTCKLVKTRFSPESPFWLVHSIVSQCG